MNRKQIFSFRLYKDAIRQLRIIGLTATVLLTLEAVIIPIGYYLSYKSNLKYNMNYSANIMSFMEVHPLVVLSFIILAPLLTLYLFSFLNKRNSSDFYHSIPHSRTCLFLSYFSSIVTWIIIVMGISSIVSLIMSEALRECFILNTATVPLTLFNIFAGSLFVAACIAVAMCITGTTFSNIIVSGMIIFVPRIIITVILASVSSTLLLIPSENFIPILDIKYNVVIGFLFSLFEGQNGSTLVSGWNSGIYTFVVSIILIFLASILFRFRKSESAGFSAPNRFLQGAYRTIIALIVCIIPIYAIYQNNIYQNDVSSQSIFEYIIFYIIALIAFFLYELITTRKFRNLIKAIPSLLILVILNVGILFSMFGIYNHVLKFTPDADEIDSIQIMSGENDNSSYNPYSSLEYFTKATEEIKIDDNTTKQLVSDTLNSAVNEIKQSPSSYRDNFYNAQYKTVAIHKGHRTYYRKLIFSEKDLLTIAKQLSKIDEYRNVYLNLPDKGKDTVSVSLTNSLLPKKSVNIIYNTLREEVKNMNFEDFYTYLNDVNDYGLDNITFTDAIDLESYSATIPITSKLPKTYKAYFEELNKYTADKKKLIPLLFKNKDAQFSINVLPYNDGQEYQDAVLSLYWYGKVDNNTDILSDEDLAHLSNLLSNSPNADSSTPSNIYKVSILYTADSNTASTGFDYFIFVNSDEDIKFIEEITEKTNEESKN